MRYPFVSNSNLFVYLKWFKYVKQTFCREITKAIMKNKNQADKKKHTNVFNMENTFHQGKVGNHIGVREVVSHCRNIKHFSTMLRDGLESQDSVGYIPYKAPHTLESNT